MQPSIRSSAVPTRDSSRVAVSSTQSRSSTKPVSGGEGEQPLSPEEQEAVRLALAGGPQWATLET